MIPLLLALLMIVTPSAPPRATLIQRAVVGNQIVVIYDIASGPYPVVDAPGGTADVQLVVDAQGWRGRVLARLSLCGGALVVDGATVTQQRCVWLPVGGK